MLFDTSQDLLNPYFKLNLFSTLCPTSLPTEIDSTKKSILLSNLLDHAKQRFADGLLNNQKNLSATGLLVSINPNISRASARVMAANMRADIRVQMYVKAQEIKAQEKTDYALTQWRQDVLLIIDIAMGRAAREQIKKIKDDNGETVEIQLEPVKQIDGQVAKSALELIAKQMNILTNKVEHDVGYQLQEAFSKVRPTLGPLALRDK